MRVEGLQLQLRGSIDTWNRWALITLQSYYAELWKHTRTRADALFAAAIAVDGTSCDSRPSVVLRSQTTFFLLYWGGFFLPQYKRKKWSDYARLGHQGKVVLLEVIN